MKKTIEIILKKKKNLDPIKRIKKVALGYAFNYLIPNQIAEISSKGKIKHLNMIKNIISNTETQIYHNNLKIKNDLAMIGIIHIRKTCSQNMQIFGSITENDIINRIFYLIGKKLDKKQIIFESIKEISIHKVSIVLEENLKIEMKIHILPNII